VVPWGDLAHNSERDATVVVDEVVTKGSHTTFCNLLTTNKQGMNQQQQQQPITISLIFT